MGLLVVVKRRIRASFFQNRPASHLGPDRLVNGLGEQCVHIFEGNSYKMSECSTPDQTLATTNFLNNPEGEEEHAEGLGDTVETSGEELQRRTWDTETLKDAGSILLELLLLAHLVGTALLNLRSNITHLSTDIFVFSRETSNLGENLLSFFEAITTSKPTRRLGTPEHTECKSDTSIVDPEAKHTTALRGDFKDTYKTTADGRRSGFTDVHGDSEGRGSEPKASYGSSGVDHVQVSVGGGHKSAAEQED
ncbi:hypothetical protein HG530_000427 [Fusarium avenaceum]|nr:hypothetical protein HG530_000427 [Fusarium avenaceum]